MNFNSDFLNYKPIFTSKEIETLESINKTLSIEAFLDNKNLVEKFGFDFVYTSTKIEGNIEGILEYYENGTAEKSKAFFLGFENG